MYSMLPLANHCINCSMCDVSILVNLAQLFQQSSVQKQGVLLLPSWIQLDRFTIQQQHLL